jgi:hypothetical protein
MEEATSASAAESALTEVVAAAAVGASGEALPLEQLPSVAGTAGDGVLATVPARPLVAPAGAQNGAETDAALADRSGADPADLAAPVPVSDITAASDASAPPAAPGGDETAPAASTSAQRGPPVVAGADALGQSAAPADAPSAIVLPEDDALLPAPAPPTPAARASERVEPDAADRPSSEAPASPPAHEPSQSAAPVVTVSVSIDTIPAPVAVGPAAAVAGAVAGDAAAAGAATAAGELAHKSPPATPQRTPRVTVVSVETEALPSRDVRAAGGANIAAGAAGLVLQPPLPGVAPSAGTPPVAPSGPEPTGALLAPGVSPSVVEQKRPQTPSRGRAPSISDRRGAEVSYALPSSLGFADDEPKVEVAQHFRDTTCPRQITRNKDGTFKYELCKCALATISALPDARLTRRADDIWDFDHRFFRRHGLGTMLFFDLTRRCG